MRRSIGTEAIRGLILGFAVATFAAMLLLIESVRRKADRDRVRGHLWPRPDGTARSYGEVWDHPALSRLG